MRQDQCPVIGSLWHRRRSGHDWAALVLLLCLGWSGVLLYPPAPVQAQVGTIYYVDKDRPDDSGDGLTWATAKRNLQTALALASAGAEIWVADGTYYPDEGTGQTNDNRASTFTLKDGVAIYGGFAGTETLLSERDVAANVAILSGDLQQNDTPNFGNNADNALHVVTGSGTDSTAVLDGFTITAGNADDGGGIACPNDCGSGVSNDSGSPTLTNLTITGNFASSAAAGCTTVAAAQLHQRHHSAATRQTGRRGVSTRQQPQLYQ
ncbi:MAG: hypothetical protein HC876_21950, partial [Chloroflexaceae bacterium]|nr:hypothetical protein [Chloroflexaceae bacterium]